MSAADTQLLIEKVREESSAAQKRWVVDQSEQSSHTDTQGVIRDLGLSLGFDVWIASNDRGRSYRGGELSCGCLYTWPLVASDSVKLIDVVWFEKGQATVAAAFEVEHYTSIYSGIMRMLDLILSLAIIMSAPILSSLRTRAARTYQQLQNHAVSIIRFGHGLTPMLEVSERL